MDLYLFFMGVKCVALGVMAFFERHDQYAKVWPAIVNTKSVTFKKTILQDKGYNNALGKMQKEQSYFCFFYSAFAIFIVTRVRVFTVLVMQPL